MIKKMIVAAGALLMLAAGVAQAEERWPRWYVGLEGSLPFVGDTKVSQGSTNLGTMNFDNPGWGVGASLGYIPGGMSFLNQMRFEFEVAYRENSLDTLGGAKATDDISSTAYMFNAFYDVDTGTKFSPYLGAGVGFANTELNLGSPAVSDSDTGFAYQGMLGVSYLPELIPNTAFSLGYRYFGMNDPEYGTGIGKLKHNYDSHSVEAGARFAF